MTKGPTKRAKHMRKFFDAAIDNVYKHGDTDIFPFPIENRIIHDKKSDVVDLLLQHDEDFDARFAQYSPNDLRSQVAIHHTGFRWATQLDPFWNAFYLGLVLSIASEIEDRRLSPTYVYSYRLDKTSYLNGTLFRNDIGWADFIESSRNHCSNHSFVVVCDIADCYGRISHHKIDNAMRSVSADHQTRSAILSYLAFLTGTRSSGLPVGGPASRIMAELALVNADQLLHDDGIQFVRYADDYHFFCNSRREAYDILVKVSNALDNEGLSLQKSKTRIMTSSEYVATSQKMIPDDNNVTSPAQRLMSLPLRFDPYSLNAEENYEELRKALSGIDIISLLNEQLSRSKIHVPTTKKIISALRTLNAENQYGACLSMLSNMDALYPIAPTVFTTLRSIIGNFDSQKKDHICALIRDLYNLRHEVMGTPNGVAYAVRVIGEHQTTSNQIFLNKCFSEQSSPLVRRDIIIIFANWENFAWLSSFRSQFQNVTSWERRAFILASFSMMDEGKHWRDHSKRNFTPMDIIIRDWWANRPNQSQKLPL